MKALLVVSAGTPPEVPALIEQGRHPRIDYLELQRCLHAQRLDYAVYERLPVGSLVHRLETAATYDVYQAWCARGVAAGADVVVATSERAGVPLARLLAPGPALVVIGHYLSSPRKALLFRVLRPFRRAARVVCLSRGEADYVTRRLGVPPTRVEVVRSTPADARFFTPPPPGAPPGDYVLSVGLAERDYATLFAAVAGTPLAVRVIASSAWAGAHGRLRGLRVPPNVNLLGWQDYPALAEQYARARLVVVPLVVNSHSSAGTTAVQEAQAAGRAVVATRSPGMEEYLVDGETGCIVPPGDAEALRRALLALWGDAEQAAALGDRARCVVEQEMNLDVYVERLAAVVRRAAEEAGTRRAALRGD